jgi:hypothetical protein
MALSEEELVEVIPLYGDRSQREVVRVDGLTEHAL